MPFLLNLVSLLADLWLRCGRRTISLRVRHGGSLQPRLFTKTLADFGSLSERTPAAAVTNSYIVAVYSSGRLGA